MHDPHQWPGFDRPNDEPIGHDGQGAPLYAHQIPAEGTE